VQENMATMNAEMSQARPAEEEKVTLLFGIRTSVTGERRATAASDIPRMITYACNAVSTQNYT